jgi:hypothetical protein
MSIFHLLTFKQNFNVSNADKLEYGEIYTPFSLINKMLDLFQPQVFTDENKRWLDVGAGQGYFSIILFERLNIGLATSIPDEQERKKHIVENMLFMVELKPSNVIALKAMFGSGANIEETDFCSYSTEIIFDYIIGNPPYNSNGIKKVPTNKNKDAGGGDTIWTKFVCKSLHLLKPETGQLCMILPSIWLKQDKAGINQLLTKYKIEKMNCLSSNESNQLFNGEAQTPTCYFLLTKRDTDTIISLFDKQCNLYVDFQYKTGDPVPLFGSRIIQKMQKWIQAAGGYLKVIKTNMPPLNSMFTENPPYIEGGTLNPFPFVNIKSCVLERLNPVLTINYSNIPQSYYGIKKLILAHKMYGFPYFDKHGNYGISNRDNYVILNKTDAEFIQLQAFLSTKLALYIFEATRYRMKYLEKYAFQFIPDVTRLLDFPVEINDHTVAEYFQLDELDKQHIFALHKKNYNSFIHI